MISACELTTLAANHGGLQFYPPHILKLKKGSCITFQHDTARFGSKSVITRCDSACKLSNTQIADSRLRLPKGPILSRRFSAAGCNISKAGATKFRVSATGECPDGSSSQALQPGTQGSGVLSAALKAGGPGDSREDTATVKTTAGTQDSGIVFAVLDAGGPGGSREDTATVKTTVFKATALGEEEDSSSQAEDELGEGRDTATVKTKTTVFESRVVEGDEHPRSELEEVLVEEYKLTEEGKLSAVVVSHTMKSRARKMLLELKLQAETLREFLKNFSVRSFIRNWGKKPPGLEDLKFNAAMYAPKEGISTITQWTATELTLQRAQMVRIARDTLYLVWAFSLFGVVRILEALVTVFSTSPPQFKKLLDASNALDPLTVASLAYALRKPIVGMLNVDPTNLEEVNSLKAKFWGELHNFYERQWKVMATLAVARLLTLISTNLPSAQWVAAKFKIVWDISMALPIF